MAEELHAETGQNEHVRRHLQRFAALDFEAFNQQNWELFNQLHTEDVVVTYPDGRQSRGHQKHDQALQALFDWAPDLKIMRHTLQFGSENCTAVTGELAGTFSRPLALGDGKRAEPTGRAFRVPMCTIARWKEERIAEVRLFWDHAEIWRQIGLAAEGPVEPPVVASMREDY